MLRDAFHFQPTEVSVSGRRLTQHAVSSGNGTNVVGIGALAQMGVPPLRNVRAMPRSVRSSIGSVLSA
jgi:hypothetical protein